MKLMPHVSSLVLAIGLAFAQAPVGTISGVIADDSGAVIPNAQITIRNKATGAERSILSKADGTYSAAALREPHNPPARTAGLKRPAKLIRPGPPNANAAKSAIRWAGGAPVASAIRAKAAGMAS